MFQVIPDEDGAITEGMIPGISGKKYGVEIEELKGITANHHPLKASHINIRKTL